MATRRRTSTSIRSVEHAEDASPAAELMSSLATLHGFARTAAKHRFKLGAHTYYAPKAHDALIELRRKFLILKSEYPASRHPAVATQLDALEPPLAQLEQGLDLPARELAKIIREVSYRVGSDLRAAIQATGNHQGVNTPFITPDILKPGIYRKVLEEANQCFNQNCPNACAAMLRRLVESLIIEAFEAHGIEATIKDTTGEYYELKALIGKAIAEPKLNLTRSTKNALPNLKVLGDLSVHGRRHLVRNDDLERLHNDARIAIEELASHQPK